MSAEAVPRSGGEAKNEESPKEKDKEEISKTEVKDQPSRADMSRKKEPTSKEQLTRVKDKEDIGKTEVNDKPTRSESLPKKKEAAPKEPPSSEKPKSLVSEGVEGMDVPPAGNEKPVKPSGKKDPAKKHSPKTSQTPSTPTKIPNRRPLTTQQPSAQAKRLKAPAGQSPREIPTRRPATIRGQKPEPAAVEKPTPAPKVKQFSFPAHKILSGASVAGVRMYPQRVVVQRSLPQEESPRHWAAGLFQTTKMSLKLRLLRLLIVWIFFRVLNKQTAWLSDRLGIGLPEPDDTIPPPGRPGPGERFVKVFHEGRPNPFHVRVTPDGKARF